MPRRANHLQNFEPDADGRDASWYLPRFGNSKGLRYGRGLAKLMTSALFPVLVLGFLPGLFGMNKAQSLKVVLPLCSVMFAGVSLWSGLCRWGFALRRKELCETYRQVRGRLVDLRTVTREESDRTNFELRGFCETGGESARPERVEVFFSPESWGTEQQALAYAQGRVDSEGHGLFAVSPGEPAEAFLLPLDPRSARMLTVFVIAFALGAAFAGYIASR